MSSGGELGDDPLHWCIYVARQWKNEMVSQFGKIGLQHKDVEDWGVFLRHPQQQCEPICCLWNRVPWGTNYLSYYLSIHYGQKLQNTALRKSSWEMHLTVLTVVSDDRALYKHFFNSSSQYSNAVSMLSMLSLSAPGLSESRTGNESDLIPTHLIPWIKRHDDLSAKYWSVERVSYLLLD